MRKKWIPHILAVIALVVFVALGLASMGSAPSSSGGGGGSVTSSRRQDSLCNGTGIASNFPGETGQNPCYGCGGDGYLDPGDPYY